MAGTHAVEIDVLAPTTCTLGEGPVWNAAAGELLWVDIVGQRVHACDGEGRNLRSIDVGQDVGCVVPRTRGGLMTGCRDGFAAIAQGSEQVVHHAPVEGDRPGNRLNDGACDSAGRFWAGTTADDGTPGAGALYRLGVDRQVVLMLDGVTISNGIGWSPDEHTLYYVDTPTRGVDAFDFDPIEGMLSNRRRLVDIPPEYGLPDGLAVDAEGHLWLALWDGWAVRRFTPDGVPDAVVTLPVSRVTSCAFGGPDLRTLFITSAALDRPAEPHAGSVFRFSPGVAGLPTHAYGG